MSRQSKRSYSYSGDNSRMESDVAVMQREIDQYTRKLELEKKRLYSISHMINQQENENEDRKNKIKEMRKVQDNAKNRQATCQLGTLQKASNHYEKRKDNAIDGIQKVKTEIENLRKQRVVYLEQITILEGEIAQAQEAAEQVQEQIEKSSNKSIMAQQHILELKQKNDLDKQMYEKELQELQNQMKKEKMKSERRNKEINEVSKAERSGDVQIDTFDTSGVLKRRLQKIIYKNKEKVKLIDAYIRNMTIIDGAFHQIKETTGITDIQEIQNTFIKSEEQNYSLLTYVDVLNQQSDHIQDQNKELQEKIVEQEIENSDKQRILLSTPTEEKTRRKIEASVKSKQNMASTFQSLLDKILPSMEKILVRLAGSQFNLVDEHKLFEYQNGLILNEATLETYLSDLETFMTEVLLYKAQKNEYPAVLTSTLQINSIPAKDFKQKALEVIAYKPNRDPTNEESEIQNNLLDKKRIIELAEEYLEKRKNQTNSVGVQTNNPKNVKKF